MIYKKYKESKKVQEKWKILDGFLSYTSKVGHDRLFRIVDPKSVWKTDEKLP